MRSFARLLGIGSDKAVIPEYHEPEVAIVPQQAVAEVAPDAATEVQKVRVEDIQANPFQPRKTFNEESLQELAASIKEFGIIQPLIVRSVGDSLELIAGERRLRAAKLAGLQDVPVIVREIADKEMAELAMIENLQREDLHFLEEAEGYQQLILQFGLTQEEMARRVGKNQSTIANKLRLLKLDPAVRVSLKEYNLTERHARALLKLEDSGLQNEALDIIRDKGLNVRETEAMIETIVDNISREKSDKRRQNVIKVIKDVRIFLNTINNVVADMKKVGLNISMKQDQDEEFVTITLRIPKKK